MKKQSKYKLIAFILCLSMLFTNILPISFTNVYGETTTKDSIGSINQEDDGINVGIDEKQFQQTTYSEEITENVSEETKVYVSQSSTFGVFIPKTIILDGNSELTNKGEYTVKVSSNSNIGGREVISVVPEDEFELNSYGKQPIKANVSQTRKEWLYNELDKIAYGTIIANDMTAGSWSGEFYFNIEIIDYSIYDDIVVSAIDENDVNLNATSKVITGETKETLINYLKENDYVGEFDKISLLIEVESDDFDTTALTTFNVGKFANVGDTISIFHYNETTGEWEHIATGEVDKNGYIVGNFSSFSPIAFVNENYYSNTVAGMYTMDNELIKTWAELLDEGTISVSDSGVLTTSNATTKIYDKLVVDKSVVTVEKKSFINCTNLKEVVFPENLSLIVESAFENCTKLEKITIPVSTSFGYRSFNNTPLIKEVVFLVGTGKGVNLAGGSAFATNYYSTAPWYGKTIDTIIIPEGVTSLGNYYFYGAKVSNFILPNSLTSLGTNIFSGTSIESVGPKGSNSSLEIPDGITTLGTYTFSNCDNLKKVIYPNTITTLPNYIFNDCDAIETIGYDNEKSIVLHENIATVGQNTFSGCDNLTYVDISKNIQTVDKTAFSDCVNLKEVTFSENLSLIVESAFVNCTKLEKITIPVSTSFGYNSFSNTPSIKEVVFLVGTGKGVNLAGGSAFATNYYSTAPWYGKTIDTIIIPEGVTSLGNYYFYGAKVSNFILPNSLTSLGTNIFYNSTTTTNLIIPNNVTSIGSNAFYNVPHITYNGTATGSPWGALSIN